MQNTIFGEIAVKVNEKKPTLKQILEEKRNEWETKSWLLYAKSIIEELENGKILDNNDIDGLMRNFDIGSFDNEENNISNETWEKLTIEQQVKIILETMLEFNEFELGLSIEGLTFEIIETQIELLNKELEELEQTKKEEKNVQDKLKF